MIQLLRTHRWLSGLIAIAMLVLGVIGSAFANVFLGLPERWATGGGLIVCLGWIVFDQVVLSRGPVAPASLACSFCGAAQENVFRLIAGPNVWICDACVYICIDLVEEQKRAPEAGGTPAPPPDDVGINPFEPPR